MDYFILNSLCSLPPTMVYAYVTACMIRFPRKWLYVTLYPTGCILLRILLYLAGLGRWNDVILIPMLFAVIFLAARDTAMHKLFAGIVVVLISGISEVAASLLLVGAGLSITADGNSVQVADSQFAIFLVVRLFLLLCTMMLGYISVLLWNRIIRKSGQRELALYVFFPLTQASLILCACSLAAKAGGIFQDYLMVGALTLCSVVSDAVMLLAINRLRSANETRQRADFLEVQAEQQKAYYARVKRDAEETARVRHDLRNEIAAAQSLFSTGSGETAEKLLSGLTGRLSSTQYFCRNTVVNIVMNDRAEVCRREGVELRPSLAIDDGGVISETDLCSLFSNVMDNAISGCRASESEKPFIEISASVKKGYLVLECRNSAKPGANFPQRAQTPLVEHGWGLAILEDLAARCDGRLDFGQEGGIFTITVFLRFR